MKFAIAISFLLTTSLCLAQGKEEVKRKADSIISKFDTIPNVRQALKLPSLNVPLSVKNKLNKSDSLQARVSSKYDSIKNLAFVGVLHQQTRLKRITDKKIEWTKT
jgi:hypothetical protein